MEGSVCGTRSLIWSLLGVSRWSSGPGVLFGLAEGVPQGSQLLVFIHQLLFELHDERWRN